MPQRCARCTQDKIYQNYHDLERWKAVHDDQVLFEFLILEIAQAGLSWLTILKKRVNYRKAFDHFDVKKVACYDEAKIQELLKNKWIIRNKLKINSAIHNAKVFIEIQEELGSFDQYIRWFVNHKTLKNHFKNAKEVPSHMLLSNTIAQDLKKRWMNFVWTKIIYAYIQSIWMVNNHTQDCDRY